jgi:hypothetical protein
MSAAEKDDGDWVSVTDLAQARGVSHQAISKRVRSLKRRGNLPTRRDGKAVLIHRPTFDALAAASHDPAQDLRNRAKPPQIVPAKEVTETVATAIGAPQAGAYDDAAAREKNAKAAMAEIELERRRGELVRARDLEDAAAVVGTAVSQRLAGLKALAGQLYAASKGGEDALRVMLAEKVAEIQRAIAEDMQKLVIEGEPTKAPPLMN